MCFCETIPNKLKLYYQASFKVKAKIMTFIYQAVGRVFIGRQLNKFVYFYDDIPKVSLDNLDPAVTEGIARGLSSRSLPCIVLLRRCQRPKWSRAVLSMEARPEEQLRLDSVEVRFADSTISVSQLTPAQEESQRTVCLFCKKAMASDDGSDLAAHMAAHLELLVCGLCGHTAQRKWQLLQHQLVQHDDSNGTVGPLAAPAAASSAAAIAASASAPVAVASKRPGAIHVCEHCGRGYASSRLLHNHLMSAHPALEDCEPPILPPSAPSSAASSSGGSVCHLCDKAFTSRSGLSQHLATKHNNTSTSIDRLTCVHCDKVFSSRYQYLQHRKNVHPKYLLMCPLCPNRLCFKQKSHLRKHLETRHKEAASADVEPLLNCRLPVRQEENDDAQMLGDNVQLII